MCVFSYFLSFALYYLLCGYCLWRDRVESHVFSVLPSIFDWWFLNWMAENQSTQNFVYIDHWLKRLNRARQVDVWCSLLNDLVTFYGNSIRLFASNLPRTVTKIQVWLSKGTKILSIDEVVIYRVQIKRINALCGVRMVLLVALRMKVPIQLKLTPSECNNYFFDGVAAHRVPSSWSIKELRIKK